MRNPREHIEGDSGQSIFDLCLDIEDHEMFCNLKNIRNIHNEKLVEEYFHLLDEMEKDNVQSPTQSKLGCNNTNINLLDVNTAIAHNDLEQYGYAVLIGEYAKFPENYDDLDCYPIVIVSHHDIVKKINDDPIEEYDIVEYQELDDEEENNAFYYLSGYLDCKIHTESEKQVQEWICKLEEDDESEIIKPKWWEYILFWRLKYYQ